MNNFSDPTHNIQQLQLAPNMMVADFGSGAGFYTIAAAQVLANGNGKVYAVDLQKEMLQKVLTEAQRLNLQNVEIVWGDMEEHQGSKLRNESIDVVLISNTLFQMMNKVGLIKEAFRVLKPGGRALVIDWTESFGGLGPQMGNIVTQETARSLMESEGFLHERDIEAGAHHYGMIFHKK